MTNTVVVEVITPRQLVEGLKVDDLSMSLAEFVANELNEALAYNTPLSGLDWFHTSTKCGCLVTTAAQRVGLSIPEYATSSYCAYYLPERLSEKVNIDANLLADLAFGFTLDVADEVYAVINTPNEWCLDDVLEDYGYATVLGARALLLFRDYGGTIIGEEEDNE